MSGLDLEYLYGVYTGNLTDWMMKKVFEFNNKEFLTRCNKIISKAFDFLKIEINITALDYTYSYNVGFLKVTVNAKSGGTFLYGGDKYIFKLSGHCQTTGLLLNSVDFISEAIDKILCIQIKNKINMFKQKVGESIVNGAVTISFQFPKLIYEFELAKDEK